MAQDILIVDDEADIRELIADMLSDEGYVCRGVKNSTETFEAFAEKIPSALVLDIWLKDSDLDGLGILETVRRKYPSVPVVMISGHGTIETAVKSLKMGAYDYIEKPFKQDRILHVLKRAIETFKLKSENVSLKMRSGHMNLLIGDSPAVVQLRQHIDRIAPTNSRVLITGGEGAGKESIARGIHAKSTRKQGPFVVFHAASLSPDMVEAELFGTEESTDLNSPPRRVGLIENANGGTLYIDEVTDIPIPVQGKLVRFLQDGTFKRLGGDKAFQSDVRVISSSSKDIHSFIKDGSLREDLYYRLNVVPLVAPSLRERREDIPLICDYFLAQSAQLNKTPTRQLSDDALAALQAYNWPGNIRQLKNVVEWLLIMSNNDNNEPISSDLLPQEIFSTSPASITPQVNTDIMSMKLREAREVFERQYLVAQINRFGGNISRTASFIGMERSALHRKLKSLNIGSEEETGAEEESTDVSLSELEKLSA